MMEASPAHLGLDQPVALRRFKLAAASLACWSVLTSAMHLWPFEGNHSLEMVCPANWGLMGWIVVVAITVGSQACRKTLVRVCPPPAVWGYLAISAASVAFAPKTAQSAISAAKLTLMYVGAFCLYRVAMDERRFQEIIMAAATAAVCLAVAACWAGRLWGQGHWGLFANRYKYAAMIGMLAPLVATFLACGKGRGNKVPLGWLGTPIAMTAVASCPTVGGVIVILTGLVAGLIVANAPAARLRLGATLIASIAIVAVVLITGSPAALKMDLDIRDRNGHDLKQRYIEWQADLNLLAERPVTGTGSGCVNDYRGTFYDRLPKLNTLEAFDRNGWLLTAAETGLLGLVCFVWAVMQGAHAAYMQARPLQGDLVSDNDSTRFAAAALAGLAAACVANVFCWVNYNGVVNVFVLILAMGFAERSAGQDVTSPSMVQRTALGNRLTGDKSTA